MCLATNWMFWKLLRHYSYPVHLNIHFRGSFTRITCKEIGIRETHFTIAVNGGAHLMSIYEKSVCIERNGIICCFPVKYCDDKC